MTTLSLRARVFLGALLWSVGLFLGAGLLLTHYMLFAPQAPGIFHGFFFHFMWPIAITTVVCLIVGLGQVRRGLASFDELRARLVDVREGRQSRLEGEYPAEVQPLVSDLNSLLSDREQRVSRALTKAGDLAHGLKTPLAVLKPGSGTGEGGGPVRRGCGHHAAGRSHAPAGGLPPRPGARVSIGRQSGCALPRADVGRRPRAHHAHAARGPRRAC